MSKKILSGVLAAATMLSLSTSAFAAGGSTPATPEPTTVKYDSTTGTGASYTVTANVSYGTVDVTIPKALNGVIINPYGAAVKTTLSDGTTTVASKSAIASEVYEIKNNDATDGIKVIATVAVTKASNLKVVDGTATMPTGWDTAVDAKDSTVVVNQGKTFNPLVSYDKITAKTDKTSGTTTYTGGGESAKQTKNVALRLIGANDAEKAVIAFNKGVKQTMDKTAKAVEFAPKGNTTGELGTAEASGSVFFSVDGDINPNLPADTEWTAKDSLSLSVVLKVLPVVAD